MREQIRTSDLFPLSTYWTHPGTVMMHLNLWQFICLCGEYCDIEPLPSLQSCSRISRPLNPYATAFPSGRFEVNMFAPLLRPLLFPSNPIPSTVLMEEIVHS